MQNWYKNQNYYTKNQNCYTIIKQKYKTTENQTVIQKSKLFVRNQNCYTKTKTVIQ